MGFLGENRKSVSWWLRFGLLTGKLTNSSGLSDKLGYQRVNLMEKKNLSFLVTSAEPELVTGIYFLNSEQLGALLWSLVSPLRPHGYGCLILKQKNTPWITIPSRLFGFSAFPLSYPSTLTPHIQSAMCIVFVLWPKSERKADEVELREPPSLLTLHLKPQTRFHFKSVQTQLGHCKIYHSMDCKISPGVSTDILNP